MAARLVEHRPLALNLDIDVVRGQLGAWLERPTDAGLAARRLALEMARVHLTAGHDVVVPQFLGRLDFVHQLDALAASLPVRFIELALMIDPSDAAVAFEQRRLNPTHQTHLDAAALLDAAPSDTPLLDMHAALLDVLAARPATRRIDVLVGDIESTFALVEAALQTA